MQLGLISALHTGHLQHIFTGLDKGKQHPLLPLSAGPWNNSWFLLLLEDGLCQS